MILKSLKIKNFLGYTAATIDFGKATFIFGRNEQGKSSIRDAIEYALLGTARGIRLKKDCLAMARTGTNDFEVAVEGDVCRFIRTQANRWVTAGDQDCYPPI